MKIKQKTPGAPFCRGKTQRRDFHEEAHTALVMDANKRERNGRGNEKANIRST